MRSYIRHPSGMPINVRPDKVVGDDSSENLNNIGYGGLSFTSQTPLIPGAMVALSVPMTHGDIESRARVAWCSENSDGFEIGVEFMDAGDFYTVRMVEQVCHIEHYKNQTLEKQGRELSCQEAAEEWIEKYAADFPAPFIDQQRKHH